MPLKISNISTGSLAEKANLKSGELLICINDKPINDYLDLQFHSADKFLKIEYLTKNGTNKKIVIKQDWEIPLGIELSEHQCRFCINNCIFCFIDQMKSGLRKSLYIKDDDYRLSFTFGNFITLTNLTDMDFQKIIEQKLSPLYISVQTTNSILHKKMMRYKHNFNILEKLQILSKNNIKFHTQIVIIPDWNDGDELQNSLKNLTSKNLNTLSVGIVPVGLTKFRKSLNNVQSVDKKQACKILELTQQYPKTYCSDEIYLLANTPIPPEDFYDSYPQLENGIGMIRLMLENWKINKDDFIADISNLDENIVFVTGTLAEKYLKQISDEVNSIFPNKTRVKAIENKFFGNSVTVAGLLTAQDIVAQINLQNNEIVAVSCNIFNHENITLDDIHNNELREKLTGKLLVIDEEFDSWQLIKS